MSLPITKNSFTFIWNIVNVSLCDFREYQGFFSPPFKSEALVNTEWYLKFTPIAAKNGTLSVDILRRCLGKATFNSLDYDLSFIAADGTLFPTLKIMDAVKTESSLGENLFLQQSQLVGSKKDNILYKDALTVRFRIWTYASEPHYCLARTVLHKITFPWNIKRMPTDEIIPASQVLIQLPTLHFTVILDEFESYLDLFNMRFKIFTTNGNIEDFAHCKISAMDPNVKEQQELFDFFACSGENTLSFQTHTKLEYLVDDMLSLQWHFTFGISEFFSEEANMASDGRAYQTDPVSVLAENTDVTCTALQEDLLQFYREKKFSDVTLVAGGISFPVHKSILCARSQVFRALFGTEGQPRFPFSEGYVDCSKRKEVFYINDIQVDTLDRMLFYIYTGTLPAMQWTCVSSLYDAASKYGIRSLKQKCQSVLKSQLSVSKACQILALADTHEDEDLKQCAWDFICEEDDLFDL